MEPFVPVDLQREVLDTPFESPAEYEFAYHLLKYVRDDVLIAKQVVSSTERGTFRIDFVLTRPGLRLGVEVDGRPYHNYWRDRARDALVLAAGTVDEMVRVAARGVVFHVEDVFFLLAQLHPPFFSPRGRENLLRLSSPYARLEAVGEARSIEVYYPMPDNDPDLDEKEDWYYETPATSLEERDLRVLGRLSGEEFLGVGITRRPLGCDYPFVEFARARPAASLDALVEDYWMSR
jgi:hypothetical protein